MTKRVIISDIRVRGRFRKDMGDISELAKSISDVGLLHPVVVTPENELIAGARRLRAAKSLGWDSVPVTVVDLDKIVKGEFAENAVRKDFVASEIVAITKAVEAIVAKEAKERQQEAAKHGKEGGRGKKKTLGAKNPKGKRAPKTKEKVAQFAGVSATTLRKIEAVTKAAKDNPEKFGDLVEMMDDGKVNAAFRMMRQRSDEARVLALEPVAGRFKTLVIDPPWDYEWLSLAGRAAPGYATMSHDELMQMDIDQWVDPEFCHMYLWVTNNFLTRGVELMREWGFNHKTVLTWVKPRIGLGSYFRNSTEHVLFGTRGDQSTRRSDIPTHFEAPVGKHSEKPEAFYEIVRAASYPSDGKFGEIFQREERPDFKNLYALKQAVEAAE